MLKQGGKWKTVDWQTALEYVANGLNTIRADHGADSIGTLASPHSTLEELFLAAQIIRGLGSDNIDYRLRNAEFAVEKLTSGTVVIGAHWLGTSIASLSNLQRVLVVGSNLRKDHPLFAQRIRQSARMGCAVNVVGCDAVDWAMPVSNSIIADSKDWGQVLAQIAAAVALAKNIAAPIDAMPSDAATAIAESLLSGDRKAILLGNASAHHAKAASLLAFANWIGAETGASVGYLTESANTVGAQLAQAMPIADGLNASQMLSGAMKGLVLLNTEPEFDSAAGSSVLESLQKCEMVVTLSPFKANLSFSDVILPIAPFTETPGTFVNAEGRVQSFHAVVKPLGETRPGWKVLRVLANLLSLPRFDYESAQDVLARVAVPTLGSVTPDLLSNHTQAKFDAAPAAGRPVVASVYALDGIVRRATSLQLTADAKQAAVVDRVAA